MTTNKRDRERGRKKKRKEEKSHCRRGFIRIEQQTSCMPMLLIFWCRWHSHAFVR